MFFYVVGVSVISVTAFVVAIILFEIVDRKIRDYRYGRNG